ncbi:MAG: HAD-IA family hydrolase [Blastocatellia bacterium]|nr:HAD-IA family hydrolase [Blastocatellia bacterium]
MTSFLFFDVGGTLLHFSPSHAEAVGRTLRELGVDVSPERATEAVRTARRSHDGRPNPVDLDANRVWWLGLFERMLAQFGLDPLDPIRDELYERHRSGEWLHPADDTISTLDRLAGRGHRLAIISNWDDTLDAILERRDLRRYFDFVVASAQLGSAKPDRRIFETALRLADVRPDAAVHVGDEYDADVRGARGAGIRPILLVSHRAVPAGESAETIESLEGLLDIVR